MLATTALLAAALLAAEPDPADLVQRAIIVDTHIDVPYRLKERWQDVTAATERGDFDYPRARAGGLDVAFMSIYTPSDYTGKGGHTQLAHTLIDSMEALATRAPDRFMLVRGTRDAALAAERGKIGIALGMENGSPLGLELEHLETFVARGIRYVGLAHAKSNHLADASYDVQRPNEGLSETGKQAVRQLNELGVMIDLSHLSDEAVRDVLAITKAPVIASHSSTQIGTPDWERNLSDDLIRAVGQNGGVVQINFGSSFVSKAANSWFNRFAAERLKQRLALGDNDEAMEQWAADYRQENPFPFASIDDVVANIQHVIELTGMDHVGLGSDFDGVGDSLPVGLKSVADYPNLVAALYEAGLNEQDIRKILGDNLLRVWRQVEACAARTLPGCETQMVSAE